MRVASNAVSRANLVTLLSLTVNGAWHRDMSRARRRQGDSRRVRSARCVVHTTERPLVREPPAYGTPQRHVELRTIRTDPRQHSRVVLGRLGRIDVDAADHLAVARIEHGVREPSAIPEVFRVP